MTNRAFIPPVRAACRAQCAISGSAAKQHKERGRETDPHPSRMPTLWHANWEQPTRKRESTATQMGYLSSRVTRVGEKGSVYLPRLWLTTAFSLLGPTASYYFQKHILFFWSQYVNNWCLGQDSVCSCPAHHRALTLHTLPVYCLDTRVFSISRKTQLTSHGAQQSDFRVIHFEWFLNYYCIYFPFPHLQPLSKFTRQLILHILLNTDSPAFPILFSPTQALNLTASPAVYIFITNQRMFRSSAKTTLSTKGTIRGEVCPAMVCICKPAHSHRCRCHRFWWIAKITSARSQCPWWSNKTQLSLQRGYHKVTGFHKLIDPGCLTALGLCSWKIRNDRVNVSCFYWMWVICMASL